MNPVQPPIAPSKPCRQCTKGRALGRNLLCAPCRKENEKGSKKDWTVKRDDVMALKRRVAELEKAVDAICRQLLGCKVKRNGATV